MKMKGTGNGEQVNRAEGEAEDDGRAEGVSQGRRCEVNLLIGKGNGEVRPSTSGIRQV